MAEMSKVEEVARAIDPFCWAHKQRMPRRVEASIVAARAAIEAMREPTKAMDEVGRDHNYSRYVTAAWQAMIDEALSEEVAG